MPKLRFETSDSPVITIDQVTGEFSLKGQNANEVVLKTSVEEGLEFDQQGDALTLACPGDCTLYVPHHATIRVEQAAGGARLKSLDGDLSIGSIGGELSLRDVAGVTVENVGLDLSARRIRGNLAVENIGRAAIIRDIDGQFHAENVGAHLNLRDVSGGVVAAVGGNAEVFLSPVPWQTYAIQVGGNLNCRLEEDVNARVSIRSGAQKIRLNLPDLAQTITAPEFTAELGEGGPLIRLEAGGAVDLRSRSSGWESFGTYSTAYTSSSQDIDQLAEQIETEVTSQIEALTDQVDAYLEQMELGLDQDLSEAQRARIISKMQRAQEKSQRAGERVRNKLERKLDAARRKLDRESGRGWSPVVPPVAPVPSSPARRFVWPVSAEGQAGEADEAASDEERLLILQMLEQKQITADEAEQLLAALEGE